MKKWQVIASVVTLCTMSFVLVASVIPTAQAAAVRVKQTSLSEALASVRGMLQENATVSYRRPASITAPMKYVAEPTASTQAAIDTFNKRNEVTTQLVRLQVDPIPVWHNASAYMVYAKLIYNEAFAKTHRAIHGVTWNYLFVSMRQPVGTFRVTDVMPITPIIHHSVHSSFDYAPAVPYDGMSAAFKKSLDHYEALARYPAGRLSLRVFGYTEDPVSHQLLVYLFVHDGLAVPAYAIAGDVQGRLHGAQLFQGRFALAQKDFGILFPAQTRFTVITLPASAADQREPLGKYELQTTFQTEFSYRAL